MIILTSEQVQYCNLINRTERQEEHLPGISYQNKLYAKVAFFHFNRKSQALEFCRNQFFRHQEKFSYVLIQDNVGFTVWKEDNEVTTSNGAQKVDTLEQIDLQELVSQMRGHRGVSIKNRDYNLRFYPKTFIGKEAVSWFKKNLNLSKDEAIRLGQKLIDQKIVHHVLDKHTFKNEFIFYRFYCDESV